MALFVPAVVGGATVGAVAYQKFNPPAPQDARDDLPRNLQDWRLYPQEDIRRMPTYWRNAVNRRSQPIEDAYRSTYNNMYTNGPKMMHDALTGQIRFISPNGNSQNDTIIDHPGLLQEEFVIPRAPIANRSARNKRQYTMPTK